MKTFSELSSEEATEIVLNLIMERDDLPKVMEGLRPHLKTHADVLLAITGLSHVFSQMKYKFPLGEVRFEAVADSEGKTLPMSDLARDTLHDLSDAVDHFEMNDDGEAFMEKVGKILDPVIELSVEDSVAFLHATIAMVIAFRMHIVEKILGL